MILSKASFLDLLVIIALPMLFFSCNNSYIDQIDRGNGYKYSPGHPEFRISTSSYYDVQDSAKLNISVEIVYGSLIYKKPKEFFEATANMDIEVIHKSNSNNTNQLIQYPIKIREKEANITTSQETLFITKEFTVKPGEYLINITLTDSLSDKSTFRSDEITIPNLNSDISSITDIKMLTKSSGNTSFSPVTTYDISDSIDSLKFVFQVLKQKADKPLTLDMKLYRFEADSSFARRMNSNNYSTGSIFYKGIDYDERKLVNSRRRTLTETGSVLIELVFLKLDRGNYRLEVISQGDGELFKGIDFSVKSKNYPTLKSASELAKPLAYLMTRDEYESMMAIKDQDSLKKSVDRFWLRNIQNSSTARSTLSLYYERVEEANKLFANFKEGWKTDMGMMYILFGPPWRVNQSVRNMTWSYSYNLDDPERNFNFFSPKMNNKFFPFDHYVLERNSFYYNLYYQQIQLWLSGDILSRDI